MIKKTTFCEVCRKDVNVTITEVAMKNALKGEEYEYNGKRATCSECGSEVYAAEVEDNNLKALYDAYRKSNSIISLEKILEIPKKYGIGKRPLSLMLGWGEMTFSRYCDGDMPTKQYSDILLRIYNEPAYYLSVLENNKDKLKSTITYEKSKRITDELIGMPKTSISKIDIVIDYLLCKCEDITPLALQKALYYIQGFCKAFMDMFIFEDDCEAWAHGPVYPEVYQKYSSYRFDPIDGAETCDDSALAIYEKAVIDSVIKNLCCYSGKILEGFTHAEEPWLKTRGDLPVTASSNRIITKNLIDEYFSLIKEQYKMINPADIENYSKKMFNQNN